jgi:Slp family outer membrane lipoprotein
LIVSRLRLLASLPLLAACARVPPTLQGTFPPLTVAQAQAQAEGVTGERVRWGGAIVSTTPQTGETCLEVVSKPLGRTARPLSADDTFGRFIACASGFYDPAVYSPGRDVTVVGTLEKPTTGKVGQYDYSFPRVRAESVYLWPKRELRDVAYYPYGFWGYPGWGWGWGWGWGPPYWGWYRGGRFIGRTVRPGRRR